MSRFIIRFSTVLLLTAGGCIAGSGGGKSGSFKSGGCPSCGAAELLPQCTLDARLPQSTLDRACPVTGGDCKCGCQEGLECTCAKNKAKWVACMDGTADFDWKEGNELRGKYVAATGLYHAYDGSRFVSTVRLPK